MTIPELILIILGGINLGFLLKVIFNDIHYLRKKLDEHIQFHLDRDENEK